jgi:hypothetical protein
MVVLYKTNPAFNPHLVIYLHVLFFRCIVDFAEVSQDHMLKL